VLLVALLVASCVEAVLEGAPLFELHATKHEKKIASKNVLNKQESRQVEFGIRFFYSQQVRAVNRMDVLKYVRAAVRVISRSSRTDSA
jgi:hypothetical protein